MVAGNRLLVRFIQASAVLLVAALCLAAVALGWAALVLRGLSDDISRSQARLPAPVRAALPADSGISAGAAVLFSTVPGRELAAFLTLPPSTRVNGSPLNRMNTQTAIAALGAEGIA